MQPAAREFTDRPNAHTRLKKNGLIVTATPNMKCLKRPRAKARGDLPNRCARSEPKLSKSSNRRKHDLRRRQVPFGRNACSGLDAIAPEGRAEARRRLDSRHAREIVQNSLPEQRVLVK